MGTACQNLWDLAKAVLQEKFVTLSTNIEKKKKIPNQLSIVRSNFPCKKPEEEQTKPKANRKKN